MHLHEVISKNLILGDPFTVHGLGIIPLLGDTALDLPPIDLLERALDGGTLKITEVSEGGSVPFLRAENNGSKPVLILDGEELTGGKQNRIVNTTIIIAAETSIKIPVSCVEAGRWNRRREDFASGEALFRAKSRAVQKAGVAMSIRMEGNFRSDQGQVWREVDESLSELRVQFSYLQFHRRPRTSFAPHRGICGPHPTGGKAGRRRLLQSRRRARSGGARHPGSLCRQPCQDRQELCL